MSTNSQANTTEASKSDAGSAHSGKIVFTKNDILELNALLPTIKGYPGVKFNYAISKNIDRVSKLAKILLGERNRIVNITNDFEKERLEAIKDFCHKNADGSPKMIDTTRNDGGNIINERIYDIKNMEEWLSKFGEIKAKHESALELQVKEQNEFNELLKTKSEYVPFKIEMDWIPESILTEHMNIIYRLINHSE